MNNQIKMNDKQRDFVKSVESIISKISKLEESFKQESVELTTLRKSILFSEKNKLSKLFYENYNNSQYIDSVIQFESEKFKSDESFIISSFDDEGQENYSEYHSLQDAIHALEQFQSVYNEEGASFNSLMSEPTLCHPSGEGYYWNLNLHCWSEN